AAPKILWMSPHSIADIHNDLRNLAALVGREALSEKLISANQARLEEIRNFVRGAPTRRVFCAEWIDPLFCCGHWVPEQLEIAGGFDSIGRKWNDSVRVSVEDVKKSDPEVVIVMPCGFDLQGSIEQAERFAREHGDLSAVKRGQLFAVDAAYFSRPSLRVIEGVEMLTHILHPERISARGDLMNGCRRI
ncbi:MAG TPA: ABC transporter substrate-binding protein, partial [Verrucomicrobiae bacterium]|nr:ABC transporter substrate-binding protein [Verrucomicrobiae bacterium]